MALLQGHLFRQRRTPTFIIFQTKLHIEESNKDHFSDEETEVMLCAAATKGASYSAAEAVEHLHRIRSNFYLVIRKKNQLSRVHQYPNVHKFPSAFTHKCILFLQT